MSTKHTRRAPNDGNTHGPSWRAGYDAGHARHEALLAALQEIRDMDYVPQFAERVAEIARAAIEACEEV